MGIQLQSWLVWSMVGGSFVYAAWVLMPSVARRTLASGLLRLPVPLPLASAMSAYFERLARTSGGCNCIGCDQASVKRASGNPRSTSTPQTLVFHPRQRR